MAPEKDPARAARFEKEGQEFSEDLDMARIMVNIMREEQQQRREQQQERHFFQQELLQLQQQIMGNQGNNQDGATSAPRSGSGSRRNQGEED